MTKENNEILLKKAKSGDKESFEKIIEQNSGLVKKIAAKFKGRGCEYEDLVQIGTMGMIKAVRDFDFSYNTVFSTYAVPLIIGEIRKFLRDDGIIKVSRNIKKNGIIIMHCKEVFEREHNREPKLTEICEITKLDKEEVIEALDALSPIRSLQEPLGDDGQTELSEVIFDKENEIDKTTERIALKEALNKLPKDSQKLIYLRYFKNLSQQKTGEILGVSQVKVSREEKRIIDNLRKAL